MRNETLIEKPGLCALAFIFWYCDKRGYIVNRIGLEFGFRSMKKLCHGIN